MTRMNLFCRAGGSIIRQRKAQFWCLHFMIKLIMKIVPCSTKITKVSGVYSSQN
ncbi:BgTH12-03255 [Blumeria graminis f. sp. triticale]|uniref:Bgt-1405-2 n=3 Tax=Blumeria graminis TaxID=34373 RepID=A0A061HBS1_BLUGR|nr:hypothetical protein BGT96224_1405B [Blumeria graminis f. sp. tritici 96224]CAD6503595.1 BgTH12-03255 [Blumeria graminis f. sp. triticale]VDB89745.1 Bgt-1405-2 [Blumeria graminis f. sp. tritici]